MKYCFAQISAFIWLILSSIAIHKVLHSDPVMIKQNSPELYNAFIHLSENMGLLVGLLVLMILTILSDGLSLYPACTKKKPNLLIVVLVFSAIVTVGWLYVGIGALIGRDYFGGVFLLVLIGINIHLSQVNVIIPSLSDLIFEF